MSSVAVLSCRDPVASGEPATTGGRCAATSTVPGSTQHDRRSARSPTGRPRRIPGGVSSANDPEQDDHDRDHLLVRDQLVPGEEPVEVHGSGLSAGRHGGRARRHAYAPLRRHAVSIRARAPRDTPPMRDPWPKCRQVNPAPPCRSPARWRAWSQFLPEVRGGPGVAAFWATAAGTRHLIIATFTASLTTRHANIA